MQRVAILMTVYNRKEKTVSTLENCYRQIDFLKDDNDYEFSIFMVDDGCTDGTAEEVRSGFPGVHLISGLGGLYWNNGIRTAWDEAAKEDFDFYLWLNNNALIHEGAFKTLLDNSQLFGNKAIMVGTAIDSNGRLNFGGRTKSYKIVEPDSTIPIPCYTFDGDLVLVPKAVYDVLGNLDGAYRHRFGDYDYGVRACNMEIPRAVAPGILADCDHETETPNWRDSSYSLRERRSFLQSPKGRPLKEQFRYDLRSSGLFKAINHYISLNMKVLFPKRSKKNK